MSRRIGGPRSVEHAEVELRESDGTPPWSSELPVSVNVLLLHWQAGGQEAIPSSGRRPKVATPIVASPQMRQLYERVGRVARGAISVLLLGETGVGKEVMAQALHARSPRAGKPFLPISCAELAESLLESELFGHEAGSFSGATRAKPGLIEMADGGTVFLDEVGELHPSIQVKLLRVLEEQRVRRVGGVRPRDIDVRFIAATNRDLAAGVKQGAFRQDLFFRLNGVSLTIPPLRERVEEIPLLAQQFCAQCAEQLGISPAPELSPQALSVLMEHDWPGNVRELRNVVERAIMLSSGPSLQPEHLDLFREDDGPLSGGRARELPKPDGDDEEGKRAAILQVLTDCAFNQTKAAKRLGMSRRTLIHRIEEYGFARPKKPEGGRP
ncbi:sigma-54 interaction domain-containing protein [Chondromyces crocatus]|uniref:Fis family transcriptional regulator n=1 Tax=Chondromyces crocatus TaxID=52 RepID=A0A0K1E7U9_CHOCO|nr:sigma-54 dependent transcriptional regulator [Chondromyces crocatus]AKT36757.1 Fis family transcriptional regulator [Chondromyces crocatus]